MKKLSLLVALFLFAFKGFAEERQYVIVLSLDGFRWDYNQIIGTPNLDRIAERGVRSKGLQPVFPTGTFANHYSMATGLFPDNHGIIANTFFNQELQKEFRLANREAVGNPKFYGGEPIWNTVQRYGLKSASFFWVGTEAPIGGKQPNIWKNFNSRIPFHERVDSVISWLERPEDQRPQLIMFYFEEPDFTAHSFHPTYAEEVHRMVRYCDSLVGVLDRRLQALPFAENISLIIVSDHGMTPTDISRVVFLHNYLCESWIQYSSRSSPMALMTVYPEKLDTALSVLQNVPHINAWRPEDIPKHLNFGRNPNIGNLVILADSAWSISKEPVDRWRKGDHGFDNTNRDMFGIFYARGPKFHTNRVVPEFLNIQLYNIIAHLLGIRPAPNDAKLEEVYFLFR
ncbi:MAG: ectonucleotide pyrophosphatase/phosphodiesterase [Bacteroidales bacterium]|nr:ectonucleotide pyrophosphatase/phosphodiesterase [Bacteroidales bacterium]